MPVLTQIYRFPVKGLSAQSLARVELKAGRPLPHDRAFALVRPGAPFDVTQPAWAKKGMFVMLMLDEALAGVQTALDVETGHFRIHADDCELLEVDLTDEADRGRVGEFFGQLIPSIGSAPTLVRAPDAHFMDKPDNVISLINLATVRSLEQQWDTAIDPLRFRANFYIDGADPWAEFDWIGHDIRIGGMRFRVDRRNGRCGATNVDPRSGRRDLDLPGSLRRTFGHKDLGVYLLAQDDGHVAIGDPVDVRDNRSAPSPTQPIVATTRPAGGPLFMCGGCYFIYDPFAGLPDHAIPPGTPFAAIPADWRCPDCGTDKSTFRPHDAA